MRTSAVERICNLPKLALTLSLQNWGRQHIASPSTPTLTTWRTDACSHVLLYGYRAWPTRPEQLLI
jgi:hypothetical protein